MNMNTYKPPSDIEIDVRRLSQPDPATVQRVVAKALRDSSLAPRRLRTWRWAGGALLAFLATGAIVWPWRRSQPSRLEQTTLTVTGNRTFVVAERSDGHRWIVSLAPSSGGTGGVVIVVER